ncbi:N-acetylmuramidase domain-containing protein [Mesorhizobium sp. BE184]|uniref:N-acetylmuramidase domain-containing protein n=1 Tax=Mesorhizobium sp. BE184 TaxID=2817714 RepID=UPI002856A8C9|nr:N-acetylmuramidase domain-containing protein [Mesorhizobium sp. BE184]MDR7034658.1 hypothetical protein [Mesorhizobium sp. BE184]
MFTDDVVREIAQAAAHLGLEPALLLAVAEVESAGKAFAVVKGRREPLIRFEGHYFDRRLDEEKRTLARRKGLASPEAGAIANPASQAARWRMVEAAAAIDAKAAFESVSWGLGQVMGSHWAWLGYASVDALAADARSGVAGQAGLMLKYIEKAGLTEALRKRDWAAFARGYNGPGYKQNAYDAKIAAAYRRYAGGDDGDAAPADAPDGSGLLRQGSRGDAVAKLQQDLAALGYPVVADGIFGPLTKIALLAFQEDNDLDTDGIAGPRTLAALTLALPEAAKGPGFWSVLEAWLARLFGRS